MTKSSTESTIERYREALREMDSPNNKMSWTSILSKHYLNRSYLFIPDAEHFPDGILKTYIGIINLEKYSNMLFTGLMSELSKRYGNKYNCFRELTDAELCRMIEERHLHKSQAGWTKTVTVTEEKEIPIDL